LSQIFLFNFIKAKTRAKVKVPGDTSEVYNNYIDYNYYYIFTTGIKLKYQINPRMHFCATSTLGIARIVIPHFGQAMVLTSMFIQTHHKPIVLV